MSKNLRGIKVNQKDIAVYCQRNNIQKLSFFGSILRSDFTHTSDVDVLVEFEPGHIPGLIRLAALERELGKVLGRKVDLRTPQDLSPYFRHQVLAAARLQYAQ